MTPDDIDSLSWDKGQGLLPAIIQHAGTGAVLMTGYVNREALQMMLQRREVVLYSRTRGRLWVKGETSGNRIAVESVVTDCDRDALLVLGRPTGPVCHTGATTCFSGPAPDVAGLAFLTELERTVAQRLTGATSHSYTATLAAQGLRRVAQKVGEEAVEVALAAGATATELAAEAADLIFHLIVLLKMRNLGLQDVVSILDSRRGNAPAAAVSREPDGRDAQAREPQTGA